MSYEGTVKDGIIVLGNGVVIPDGTSVRIETLDQGSQQTDGPSLRDVLLEYAGIADDLPEDLADNHDHYLHGHPKLTGDRHFPQAGSVSLFG